MGGETRRKSPEMVGKRSNRGWSGALMLKSEYQSALIRPSLSGQQNVIIDAGNKALIIYSHSGRHISAFGSCFFNPQPINEIVQRSDFIF
jgi:hypothetical protein